MAKARLMDTAADYQQLGVNPNHIELWEMDAETTVYAVIGNGGILTLF